MLWQPWKDNRDKAPIALDIKEPPCKDCMFWAPRVITNSKGAFDGIVCCVADNMYGDFSCYKEKQEGK